MAKIGYVRISIQDQGLDSQVDTSENFGCSEIFREKVSGRKMRRSELDKYLGYLREGDTLVVYKLDRLGRTTKQLIELTQWLGNNNIELQIIDINIDTKSVMGRMLFMMISVFAELETNFLGERAKEGFASTGVRGHIGGRPPTPDHKRREIKFLYDE